MAAIMSDDEYDLFGKSNRRRCVKGRSTYMEQPDNSTQQDVKAPDNFNSSESYSQSGNNDFVDVDDVDEEAVTIDLSAFLNSNPLLAESLTENDVDSAASTESHSQFRVTTDSSQIVIKDLPLSSPNEKNEVECTVDPVSSEPIPPVVEPQPPAAVCANSIDVCPKNALIETIQESVSIKENIINGSTQSPKKQFKPKVTGHPRPLKSSKNVLSRIRNFNKNNVRIFGKYPKVECEMLDIDQLVKNNEIKVGNWPYVPVVRKPKINKNVNSIKKGNPLIIRPSPKLFNKPISFNRVVGTLSKARSILVDSLDSKMLKTNTLQQPPNNFSKPSFVSGEKLIKILHRNVTDARLNLQNQKFPMITSVNKVMGSPKAFKLISPKTNITTKSEKNIGNFGTPILPKPSAETGISPMMLKDFTVIQPYVEDTTSPIRPKPILTVPLDIVPNIEAVSQPTIHSSPVKSPQKPLKPSQSVFLNGGIQQISVPKKIGKLVTPKFTKLSKPLNVNETFAKPPMSATSAVVDAMTSVFNKNSSNKVKPKQSTNKPSAAVSSSGFPGLACNAYNSTLNDMLFGFDDFGDEPFDDVNDPIDDFSAEPCSSSAILDTTNNQTVEDIEIPNIENKNTSKTCSDVKSVNKDTPKTKVKRKKNVIEPIIDSDTWSASEGEIDSARIRMSVTAKKNQRKLSNTTLSRKNRRSSSSHSRTLSQDSDSALDKVCGTRIKGKKQKEINIGPATESEICLGKADIATSDPISEHQDLEKNVDFEPSSDSNSRNLEETIDVCESEDLDIVKSPKAKKETIHNHVNDSPKKLSTKDIKERTSSVNEEISDSIETEITRISKSKSATKQNSFKGKSRIVLTKGKRNQTKFQIKKKKVSKKLSPSEIKKLSRPANIIKEINTITGASLPYVNIKKGKTVSAEESQDNSKSDIGNSDTNKKSKSPKQKKVPSPKTKNKKNKTLQVLFKRPTRRSSMRSPSTQENDKLSDHDNECSSLSETSLNSSVNDSFIDKVHSTEDEAFGLEALASVSEMKSAEIFKEQNAQATSSDNVDENLTAIATNSEATLSEEISADDKVTEVNSIEKSHKCLITSESRSETQLSTSSNLSGNQGILERPFNSITDYLRKTSTIEHQHEENIAVETSIDNADSAEMPSSENIVPEDSASSTNNLVNLNTKDATLLSEVVSTENEKVSEPNELKIETSFSEVNVEATKAIDIKHDTSETGLSHSKLSELSETTCDSKVENKLTFNASNSKPQETSLSESKIDNGENTDTSQEKIHGRPKKTEAQNQSNTPDSKQEEILSVSECNTPNKNNNLEEKKRGRPRKSKSLDQADPTVPNLKPKVRLSLSELSSSSESISKQEKKTIAGTEHSEKLSFPELSTSRENVTEPDEKTHGRPRTRKSVTDNNALNSDSRQSERLSLPELISSSGDTSEVKTRGKTKKIKGITDAPDSRQEELTGSELNICSKNIHIFEEKIHGRPKRIKTLKQTDTPIPNLGQKEISSMSELNTSSENINVLEDKRHKNKKNLTSTPVTKKNTSLNMDISIVSEKQNSIVCEGGTVSKILQVSKSKKSNRNKSKGLSSPDTKNISADALDTLPALTSGNNASLENNQISDTDSITKIKTCPKVKISVAKNVRGQSRHRSSRNWYISERKPSIDSIPSDEITVLKPSERAELNRMKELKSPNSRVRPETSDKEENVESTTFITNAIVHVDATDIAADDEILAIDTHTKNQFIIRDLLNNIITSIATKANEETLEPDTSIDLPVPLDKIKGEPIDEYEAGTADLSIVKVESLPSIAADKRKSIKKSWKMGRSPVCVMAEAIISTSKKKAAPKIKPKVSTPKTPPVSAPPKSVQSAPPRIRLKNFSSEAVTIPFTQGWMRELVNRAESKPGKKVSDVYYFAPEGKKLRSMVDIGNYLSRHPEIKLTLENFTFAKELVYRAPFEIERDAKQNSIWKNIKNEPSFSETPKSSSTPKITKFLKGANASPAVTSTPRLQLDKTIKKEVCTPSKETVSKSSTESTITDTFITTSSGRQTKRKVPFDNSEPEPTPKRTRTTEKPHSLAGAGSTLSGSLQIGVPHSPSFESSIKKNEATNKKISESQLALKNLDSKSSASSRPVVVKLPSQEVKLPPLKRAKVQTGYTDAQEQYIQPPCTPRCLVPKYMHPTVQCQLCLRFFHPKCVGSKTLKFACRPCSLTKLAQYSTQKYPTINSFVDIAYEGNVFDFPDDFDMSLLVPEISMNTRQPISEPSSKTFNISCTPIRFSNPDGNASASPPSSFASKSPQLLSHLLDGNVPRSDSATPILSPEQLPKNPPFLLPANLKPSGNTKMYRVRLPAGADSVQLPNSIIIRRLPDRRIVVCSGAAVQKDQSADNAKISPSTSNASPVGPTASTSTISSIPCSIKLESVRSLANRANCVTDPTSPRGNSPNSVERTYSKQQPSRLLNTVQCDNSLSNIRNTTDKPPTKQVDEAGKKKLMGGAECLSLVFKFLNVQSLLRVSEVNRTWRYLALKNHLWKKVSFRGLQIKDWKKCCKFLHDRETEHLDLRGILHPNVFRPFMNLEKNVSMLIKLEELIVNHIPPYLLKAIISNLPQLRRLECNFVTTACTEPAIWKIPCDIELEPFRCLGRLVRLKIGSGGGIRLGSGPNFVMPYLPNLRHVVLTGFDFHSHVNLEFLSQLNDLISLELGNISSIEPEVYPLLGTLTNLKSLRLENGGSIDEVKFSEALSKMKSLEVLELMNFKVSSGLADCFKNLTQLIHVNVWPDQTTEHAVINQNLLTALSNVKNPRYVCWGIIGEGDTQLEVIHLRHPDSTETRELILEDLFKALVQMFRECRVEVKCVPRKNWREFCSTRK
ncbi:hypothetical protein JTE90_021349 [Oedothorax gibbosus]|uniref:MBD domain-containing protein n=1 Tax=Oedothorax gibbosus TaxID=931172 RepID=A0AAV6TXP4_9ARAC|nr:hypothetical protein JTE90_021349 [Oedothorax gibbosus]